MADSVTGYSNLSDSGWGYSTNGYANPLTAYSELVTANVDVYECEAGDGFEKYETYTPHFLSGGHRAGGYADADGPGDEYH